MPNHPCQLLTLGQPRASSTIQTTTTLTAKPSYQPEWCHVSDHPPQFQSTSIVNPPLNIDSLHCLQVPCSHPHQPWIPPLLKPPTLSLNEACLHWQMPCRYLCITTPEIMQVGMGLWTVRVRRQQYQAEGPMMMTRAKMWAILLIFFPLSTYIFYDLPRDDCTL